MLLSKAVEGFILDGLAGKFSPNTMRLYRVHLDQLVEFLGDPDLDSIHHADLSRYMKFIRYDYIPNRPNGDQRPLSSSSIDNHWKAIRSFFKWANKIMDIERSDLHLPQPKYELPRVIPYTEEEVKRLVKACAYTKNAATKNRKAFRMRRPTTHRDKALLLLMLDTGLRVSEVCRLRKKDINLENGEVFVVPYSSGKKTKSRTVFLGKSARRAMWRYLAESDESQEDESLFNLTTNSVRSLLRRLGERCNVENVRPHRFRHTFAIQFLRNGGNVFSLQRLLGHSTLEMVKHYLMLANADDSKAHQRASPADRWRL